MKFEYRNNQLFWYDWNLTELPPDNTPVHIIHSRAIEESLQQIRHAFRLTGTGVEIYYSFKTNPVPAFLRYLKQLGVSVEVISELELEMAIKLGFSPDRILINGAGKSDSYLSKAIEKNIGLISIWSLNELERCGEIAAQLDKEVNILLRIAPEFSSLFPDLRVNSASKGSPHGIPLYLINTNFFKRLASMKGLKVAGWHVHLGSAIHTSKPYRKVMNVLKKAILSAYEYGLKINILDLGGGFGYSAIPVKSFFSLFMGEKYLKPNKMLPTSQMLEEISQAIGFLVDDLLKNQISIQKIILEPGRSISAPTQLTIVKVLEMIPGEKKNILICDGGAMSLSPMLLTEYHRILPLLRRNNGERLYDIYGNLPSSLDAVAKRVRLPEVQTGDFLAILDTGAYFVPFENHFAGPLPGIFMIHNNKLIKIRRPESPDDMFSRDNWEEI